MARSTQKLSKEARARIAAENHRVVEERMQKSIPVDQGTLRERAMLVRFTVGRWYGVGADDQVTEEVRTKHSAVGEVGVFIKRFMSRSYLAKINAVTNDARRYSKAMTLPWGDGNTRLLASALYFEYKTAMTKYESEFTEAVNEFLKDYDGHIESMKTKLNGLFKDDDYPNEQQLRERFRFDLQLAPIPSAEDFRVDLGAEEMARVRRDIEQEVEVSLKGASREVWDNLYNRIEKLRERLKSSDKQVRSVLFDHLREDLALLPKLNLTNDPQLTAVGLRIQKEILEGLDVGAMREDDAVRSEVAKKADGILASMGSFMGKKGELK